MAQDENNGQKLKIKGIGKFLLRHKLALILIILAIVLAVSIIGAYLTKIISGKENSSNPKNAPAAIRSFTNNVTIDENGNISFEKTPRELWEELVESGNDITKELDSAEELAKLINVQTVTEYLYTGPNPETAKLDIEKISKDIDSKNTQGIIKLKRKLADDKEIYMEYKSPSEFQEIINSGNKDEALKYFTVEQKTSNGGSSGGTNTVEGVSHWPSPDSNTITSPFGPRTSPTAGASSNHGGIDIGASQGTDIEAAEAGEVVANAFQDGGAGYYVTIDHGNGIRTLYMHMNSQSSLTIGEKVTKGQVIGHVGQTGAATGPHLHFEIRVNGEKVNPLNYKYDNGMGEGTGGIGSIYNTTSNQYNDSNEETTQSMSNSQTQENTQDITANTDSTDIFGRYYSQAETLMQNMTIEEKVGQLFLASYPSQVETATNQIQTMHPGGYIIMGNILNSKETLNQIIQTNQNGSKIKMFYAVDEEGGSVTRLTTSDSPRNIYNNAGGGETGISALVEDAKNKTSILKQYGINMNLSPVADIVTNPNSALYNRSLGQNAQITSNYIEAVVKQMNSDSMLSSVKHFPGYGNNTNNSDWAQVIDNRTREEYEASDLLPFKAAISAGAPTIMVNNIIVNSMDSQLPATLSQSVNGVLRNELGYTGLILTDDINAQSLNNYDNVAVKAILAGNDVILTSNFQTHYSEVLNAVNNGTISENTLDTAVRRILACKYYSGILTSENTDSSSTTQSPGVINTNSRFIAKIAKPTSNGTVTTQEIDYQSYTTKYSMPFNYLWAMLLIGEDKDFVFDLADLVYNSEIEITVFDSQITNTTTREEQYQETREVSDEIRVLPDVRTSSSSNTSTTYSMQVALTKANTWCVYYEQPYEYSNLPEQSSTSEWEEAQNIGNRVNRKIRTKTSTTGFTYNLLQAETKGKVDKDSDEPNFVTVFNSHSKAKTNILGARLMLFEILESNQDTVDLVDLTKYLFYEATGIDYGVTDYDFDIFDPENFRVVESFYGGTFEERIWFALLDAGYSKEAAAGAMGNFWGESGMIAIRVQGDFSSGYTQSQEYTQKVDSGEVSEYSFVHGGPGGGGYGLAQWTFSTRKQGLYSFAKHKGVSIGDEDMQIEYMLGEISPSGGADGYATAQIGGLANRGYSRSDWENASTPEYAAEAFCWLYEGPIAWNGNRSTKAREYYDKYKNAEKASGSGGAYANASASEKVKFLFPNGIPTSEAQLLPYLTDISVPTTTKDGTKTMTRVQVHKAIAQDVYDACLAAQNEGFKIYSIGGYRTFGTDTAGKSGGLSYSQHCYGLAVDINPSENGQYLKKTQDQKTVDYLTGKLNAGGEYNPNYELSIKPNSALVSKFKSLGWGWGGEWHTSKDYMHFSFMGT